MKKEVRKFQVKAKRRFQNENGKIFLVRAGAVMIPVDSKTYFAIVPDGVGSTLTEMKGWLIENGYQPCR